MPKETFRLPNGKVTTDASKFVRAWKAIWKPFCDLTGAKIVGCDPGIEFTYGDVGFTLPVELVQKLVGALKKNAKTKGNGFNKIAGTIEIKSQVPVNYVIPDSIELMCANGNYYVDATFEVGYPCHLSLEAAARQGLITMERIEDRDRLT